MSYHCHHRKPRFQRRIYQYNTNSIYNSCSIPQGNDCNNPCSALSIASAISNPLVSAAILNLLANSNVITRSLQTQHLRVTGTLDLPGAALAAELEGQNLTLNNLTVTGVIQTPDTNVINQQC